MTQSWRQWFRQWVVGAGVALALAGCGGGGGGGSPEPEPVAFALTVAASGSGSVNSATGGINCGAACSATIASGTIVTLTSMAAPGHTLQAWSGACSGQTATCTVTMDAARSVTATFAPITPTTFTLAVAATGSGTVSSQPAGIDCGGACSASFASGAAVTLTATPAAGQRLQGWSGACTGQAATCSITMDTARSASANFELIPVTSFALTVAVTGSGAVSSQPAGIDCGSTCGASFTPNTVVTLTAAPAAGQRLQTWGGACTGQSATCSVTLDAALSVSANFEPIPVVTFSLDVALTGSGSVTSQPGGINCGSACRASYAAGASVVLTATPAAGQFLSAWGGACTGQTATCTVTMDAARSVTADFAPVPVVRHPLNLALAGSGSVASSPAGLSCTTSCSVQFNEGTVVSLSATPAANFAFTGWSGACTGAGACAVTMSQARDVTATFTSSAPPSAGSWSAAQLLEQSNDFNPVNAMIAMNGKGDAIVLFEQSDGLPSGTTRKVWSRRFNKGQGWQPPQAVPNLTATNTQVVDGYLFLDEQGVVTWIRTTSAQSTNGMTYRLMPGGEWGVPFQMTPRFGTDVPTLGLRAAKMDADGVIHAMASSWGGAGLAGSTEYAVSYSRLTPQNARWSDWLDIHRPGVNLGTRSFGLGVGGGSVMAVWSEENPGDAALSLKGRRLSNGSWAPVDTLDNSFASVWSGEAPQVGVDGAGNSLVLWNQGAQVWSNRYIGATSTWSGAAVVDARDGRDLRLTMNGNGHALAAWSAPENPSGTAIMRVRRFDPATGWAATPVLLQFAFNYGSFHLRIFNDNTGLLSYRVSDSITNPQETRAASRRLTVDNRLSAEAVIANATADRYRGIYAIDSNAAGDSVSIYLANDDASGVRFSLLARAFAP